jgi:hypothetical protein
MNGHSSRCRCGFLELVLKQNRQAAIIPDSESTAASLPDAAAARLDPFFAPQAQQMTHAINLRSSA